MRLLVPVETVHQGEVTAFNLDAHHPPRRREGFALTDAGTDLAGALDQANYCIWCHKQGKDSCSTGLKEKPTPDGSVVFKRSPLGVKLAGCPLEEKISEFHMAKVSGHVIGALAIITVDNPLVAATGHRICNDCMKSCIYQKQEPVNIPQAETRTLKDVLELPYGFEIYSLLTRWNPLNLKRPLPAPRSGYRILVAGMGPAGFGLAHNLLNDGHAVVGIDGLKIEPLDARVSGVGPTGSRSAFEPIERYADLHEELDERADGGLRRRGRIRHHGALGQELPEGGAPAARAPRRVRAVRRRAFRRHGDAARRLGPRLRSRGARDGRRQADDAGHSQRAGARRAHRVRLSDGLQLTGAAKRESIANLQVRLPIVVIGGGLTAIDTATEALAYYAVQVEKFLAPRRSPGRAGFSRAT